MNNILTIAIPTYNRATFLYRQLQNIFNSEYVEEVQVLVCNNGSTDNTQEVIFNFSQKHSQISYFCQPSNVGFDKNIYTIYNLAKTEFIWFLSDDDLIHPQSIKYILETIKRNEAAEMFCFAFTQLESDFDIPFFDNSPMMYTSFKSELSVSEFFKSIMISTLVVKKRLINEDMLLNIPDTYYPQITLGLILLKENFAFLISNSLIVLREPGYVTTNLFELYCLNIIKAVKNAGLKLVEEKKLLLHTQRNAYDFIRIQFLERLGFYYSKKGLPLTTLLNAVKIYNFKLITYFHLCIIFFISRTPKPIIKVIYLLGLFVKHRSLTYNREALGKLNLHIKTNIKTTKFSGF